MGIAAVDATPVARSAAATVRGDREARREIRDLM
jgi:hypothetical protein